jgi:hypothetical protein
MLEILVKKQELFNNDTNKFINISKDTTICLEHSLVSISKWESKWHKPFLSKEKKTNEEIIDYIKCMTITQNIPNEVYSCLSNENFIEVNSYIENSMTATTFYSFGKCKKLSSEVITSELIYYWMVSNNIPFECQKWHLNRLLTLIRICNNKNSASNNKMPKKDVAREYAAINAARKAKFNTKG